MKTLKLRPPRLGEWLLKCTAKYEDSVSLRGDFDEEFESIALSNSYLRAWFWYWFHLLRSLPHFLRDLVYWRIVMFMNYLKIAIRNVKKYKGYSFINITGLALGMACSILIGLWIQDELSYDRFHQNADVIYRILNKETNKENPQHYAVSPIPLAPVLKQEYPEIVAATRYYPTTISFRRESESFYERGCFVDPDFLTMYSFPLTAGNPGSALSDPFSIIIAEHMAEKYFGRQDPLGKTLITAQGTALNVTGVVACPPHNSHLQFDYIMPFELLSKYGVRLDNWDDVSWYTYIMIQKGASIEEVNRKINECMLKYRPQDTDDNYVQPLKKIHLYSHIKFDIGGHGDIKYVFIFTFTALLILIIACINFVNLATARSANRAKEVGIRKVVGATRTDVIRQFFGESIFLSLIAFILAVILVEFFLPFFNNLAGKQLDLNLSSHPTIFIGLACTALMTGVLSGSYPALLLSSFQPVKAVTDSLKKGAKGALLRKALVVFQFSLSVILIIGTLIVFHQVNFMKNKDMGFDREHVLFFRMIGELREKKETAKAELLQNPDVLSVTAIHNLPIYESSGTSGAEWEGKPEDFKLQLRLQSVDYDFLKTFNLRMAQGRFFSKDIPTDTTQSFILNETAVRAMGLKDPLEKRFILDRKNDVGGKIIGVMKDYQIRSLHNPIDPMVLMSNPDWFNYLCLKIRTENVSETIKFVEEIWKKYIPQYTFQFSFLDDAIDELYRSEERLGTIFKLFTFLAILISSLGLLGLSSYMAEQRTKEIGIRKVLGASVPGICLLLSKEFFKCVILANIIAWPIAYYVMKNWLQNFASHISITIWTFLMAFVLSLILAVLTMVYKSLQAATAQPADSLRHE